MINKLHPNREGIWEWTGKNNIPRLVEVVDVGTDENPYLRVYWWGGYYDIYEWRGTWGKRVADNGELSEDQVYLMPTEEEREKIFQHQK